MIRVTVELVSAIDPSRDRLLGVAHIANTGTLTGAGCNYKVALSKWAPRTRETWKQGRFSLQDDQLEQDQMTGTVVGFDNVKRGAWDLLFVALRSLLADRNTPTDRGVK